MISMTADCDSLRNASLPVGLFLPTHVDTGGSGAAGPSRCKAFTGAGGACGCLAEFRERGVVRRRELADGAPGEDGCGPTYSGSDAG